VSLTRIQSPTWLALLTRFGIAQPPAFDLNSVVTPVVIVDSSIPISVQAQQPLLGTPASAGEIANPAANSRLADTGALAVGAWSFYITIFAQQQSYLRVRRRNAADAADVWSFIVGIDTVDQGSQLTFRATMLAGERLVVENPVVGVGIYQAAVFATPG